MLDPINIKSDRELVQLAAHIANADPHHEPLDLPHSSAARTVWLLLIVVPIAYVAGSWWGI
jgi:hypothetical protein